MTSNVSLMHADDQTVEAKGPEIDWASFSAGFGTPGKGVGLTAGWLDRTTEPGAETLESFISGFSLTGSLGVAGPEYARTWSGPGSGFADEYGVAMTGGCNSASWGFGPLDTPLSWR